MPDPSSPSPPVLNYEDKHAPDAQPPGLARMLGLNRSTAALLIAILLIGMGQSLWQPFMPKYIEQTIDRYLKSNAVPFGLSPAAFLILAVGLYGMLNDLQEGIYYYIGGRLGGRLGTRRALILFSLLPLVGYGMLLATAWPFAVYLAMPLILAYDSFSQPATLTVVGDTLKTQYRTMAFSLQAIQRRIPRMIAFTTGGALVTALTAIGGVRAAVTVSAGLVLLAILIQVFMLKRDSKDEDGVWPGFGLVRKFHPELKKLLAADIFARIAEGMPRELFILYAVKKYGEMDMPGVGTFGIKAVTFGLLIALMSFVSLLTYIPVGYIASRPGGGKKPFIGLTFVCFATFPLAFWGLGHLLGWMGLVLAYIIAGFREIGEPARKAMITELLPKEIKTAATGIYWSIRSFAVMLSPMVGAIVWLTVSPAAAFIAAAAVGLVGAIFFALMFNRQVGQAER